MILGTGAKERNSLVQRLEKPLLARGAVTSAVIAMPMAFRRCWAIVLMLLCFCASSWGACTSVDWGYGSGSVCGCVGWDHPYDCPSSLNANGGYYTSVTQKAPAYGPCNWMNRPNPCSNVCGSVSCGIWTQSPCVYSLFCDTQAEADSVAQEQFCQNNPTDPSCVEEDVPQNCQADYAECISWGGVWKKVGSTSAGCQSECSLCGSKALTRVMNSVAASCCGKGKAPPDSISSCDMVASAGVGMSMSRFNPGWNQCGDLSTSDGAPIVENANRFNRFCNEHDMYEEQADTNDVGGGEGSSSSDAESSASGTSFGTELEALDGVYGVLDTIRDTLVKRLTPATEEIRDCLYNFKLCAQLDSLYVDWSAMPKDSTWFYIDTGLVKYLKPFMDSSVKLDSNQLKAIRKLDTNALKQLRLDSALLENDTATRRAVNNGFDGVLKNDTATRAMVKGVKDGVDSLIDSMGRYLRAVDSSIGSVGGPGTPLGDSLGHIAGLLGGIDSALNGTGSTALSGDGYGSYGSDSSGYLGTLEGAYGDGDGASDSAYTTEGDTCSTVDCIVSNSSVKVDSLENALVESLDSSYRTIEDSSETWFNQIRQNLKFVDFDSVLVQPLRDVVPNSNTCPEECFKFNADGSSVRWLKGSFDYGVCKSWTIGGVSMNPLMVVRLILRILTAVCCIYIGLWYIGGRRG